MNQQLFLSFNNDELIQFRNLVNQSNINELQTLVSLVIDKNNPEAFIERRIKEHFAYLTRSQVDDINLDDNLDSDYGLLRYHIRALKIPFMNILKELKINSDLKSSKWSPILINSLKYNKNDIESISSFQGNYYVSFVFDRGAYDIDEFENFIIPNMPTNFGKIFRWVWTPYLGLENENRIKTKTTSSEGYI